MLMNLLLRIGKGGLHNPVDLATDLQTSPELLEQMLDDLVRMGYLDQVRTSCIPASCSSCAGCCTSSIGSSSRTLALTEKGRRVISANT